MTKSEIAETLKKLRKQAGYTQKQVAELVGNGAFQTVASWESGKAQPDVDKFLHLCQLYNVENVLATFRNSPKKNNQIINIPRVNASLHNKIDKLDAEDSKVVEATVDANLNKAKYKTDSTSTKGTKEFITGKIG